MSSLAIPLPKPAGARPPFGGPPTRTAFGSSSDEGGDPIQTYMAQSVRAVLQACKKVSGPMAAETALRLIDQRKRAVRRELEVLRMFEAEAVPPFAEFFAHDAFANQLDAERLYVLLLGELDAAEAKLYAFLAEGLAPGPGEDGRGPNGKSYLRILGDIDAIGLAREENDRNQNG